MIRQVSSLFFCAILLGSVSLATEPEKWKTEVEHGSFKVHCDFPLNAEIPLLHQLEAIRSDIHRLLGVDGRGEQVHVVLFATESEYNRYMREHFPRIPLRRALFIRHRGPGMLFTHWHPELGTDLRHEVTHALLNQNGQNLPLWIDEGLAEYFEVKPLKRFRGNPYGQEVGQLADDDRVLSIQELSELTSLADLTHRHYRDSWAWAHFLIHRNRHTRQLLVRYLSEHSLGETLSGDSVFDLDRALREICPSLEAEMADHFANLVVSGQ